MIIPEFSTINCDSSGLLKTINRFHIQYRVVFNDLNHKRIFTTFANGYGESSSDAGILLAQPLTLGMAGGYMMEKRNGTALFEAEVQAMNDLIEKISSSHELRRYAHKTLMDK